MRKAFVSLLLAASFVLTPIPCSALQAELSVSAKSAVLIEESTEKIIFEKNADLILPMASTTKIMTALVALENGDLDKTVTVPDGAVGVEGSSIYLKAGEKLTLSELLYALLLESANDAATAIAIIIAQSTEAFAEMMNEKALSLGLENTHFENPHGLDSSEHYTTAKDLALLTAAALKNKEFAKIVSTYKTTISGESYDRILVNHNRLLRTYDGAIGVKTGYTKSAGRCLVTAAERDGVRLIAVTLNAPDDWNDHGKMLDYGFSQYKCFTVCDEDGLAFNIPCAGGIGDSIRIASSGVISLTLPKDAKLTSALEIRRFVWAPVKRGDYMGKIKFYSNNIEVASADLFAAESCPEKGRTKSLLEKLPY